ncbi:hypothetical protein Pint_36177 [Pistacia integerrima]|uniref:Uncharacterized protein n=1 Tax=Pistacia integerrima TaxID=434235 RepID=A0ACC0Y0S8_9ROSI|nr:hypothetical protein Pint_36177 [Pistacia integerrima]
MNMVGVDASNSVAMGDSLHHDIKGANAMGIHKIYHPLEGSMQMNSTQRFWRSCRFIFCPNSCIEI